MESKQSAPSSANAVSSDKTGATNLKYGEEEPGDGRGLDRDERTPTESASALVIAATDKAGMHGIDRARIDAIILRESGDSVFMRQQRKRDKNVDEKIDEMRRRLAEKDRTSPSGPKGWRRMEEGALQAEIQRLLTSRRKISTCVVVDMDSFYISCELLSKPELREVPACVGSGMILTSNYCARKYGVRSAMAGWIGDKLVSELSGGREKLVHLKSNHDLYARMSHKVREVLSEYDPNMRAYSLDEAYLDISDYLNLRTGKGWSHERVSSALTCEARRPRDILSSPDGQETNGMGACGAENYPTTEELDQLPQHRLISATAEVVSEMRMKVQKATGGLTCSAGIASNFMLAKIGSDRNKPNGQLIIGPSNDDILSFVRPLAVRKVPGIGRVMEKMLHAFEITTVQELFDERSLVKFLFKPATSGFLLRASLGWSASDPSDSSTEGDTEESSRKGISRERTFRPGKSWPELNSMLEDIVRCLSKDMLEKRLKAHTITLKVKLHTFDVISRSRTMQRGVYVQCAEKIIALVAEMLVNIRKQHKGGTFSVRLLGIRCSNFQEEEIDTSQLDIQNFLFSSSREDESSTSKSDLVQGQPESTPTDQDEADGPPEKHHSTVKTSTSSGVVRVHEQRGKIYGRGTGSRKSPLTPDTNDTISPVEQITPESTSSSYIKCPLCGASFVESGNAELNRHIDFCLNSSAVRAMVRQESSTHTRRRKKDRLTDFFKAR